MNARSENGWIGKTLCPTFPALILVEGSQLAFINACPSCSNMRQHRRLLVALSKD